MEIFNFIRKRSREEWSALAREKWTNLRVWLQENGELGAIAAFILGIFLVLAWKLVIVSLLIACALLLSAWFYAQPAAEKKSADS